MLMVLWVLFLLVLAVCYMTAQHENVDMKETLNLYKGSILIINMLSLIGWIASSIAIWKNL